MWEYQWSNFIYNCMSTFLHYVQCKDALLDCSAPGGERCESLTWVDEIGSAIFPGEHAPFCSLSIDQINQSLIPLSPNVIAVQQKKCWFLNPLRLNKVAAILLTAFLISLHGIKIDVLLFDFPCVRFYESNWQ